MKLLSREPTMDMIDAMWAAYSDGDVPSVVRIFRAAYDAAPEVKQGHFDKFDVFVKHDRIYFSVGNQSFRLAYEPEDVPNMSTGQMVEWYMDQLRYALSRLQSSDAQAPIWYHKHWGEDDDIFYSPYASIPEGCTALYTFPPDALAEIEALIIERDLNVRQADVSAELIKGLRTEIAKRDERIESLTSAGAEYQRQCFEQAKRIEELEEEDGLLCADCMDTGWLEM